MAEHRFYGDLASWWPLISPVEQYAEEAAELARVLATASIPVRDVLELGSGGGHNAAHLATRFDLVLVDLAEEMLDVSRRLNPGCAHHRGDMRTVRLGRTFDGVFIHDAVDYMTTEQDLRAAIATAFVHCRPGGLALFVPDATAETFEPGTDHGAPTTPPTDGGCATSSGPMTRTRPTRRTSPSTRSFSATPAARCGRCTSSIAAGSFRERPGSGC